MLTQYGKYTPYFWEGIKAESKPSLALKFLCLAFFEAAIVSHIMMIATCFVSRQANKYKCNTVFTCYV